MQYNCKICKKDFETLWGLSSHSVQRHSIKPKDIYVDNVLDGEEPICKCGCGEKPTFLGIKKGFRDFIRGHSSKINNNWGHNPEAQKKSKETQKKMYDSGEIVIWNKGLTKHDDSRLDYGDKFRFNKERSEKISKALKGRKMSENAMKRLDTGMREYWSKKENREKRSLLQSERIKKHHYKNKTKLEKFFEEILTFMELDYIPQYTICGYNFDFYLPKHDIVIEVDGDFYHCNPSKYLIGPIYESQFNTIKNDIKKNKICENSKGLSLLRFWESDINKRPEWVKSEILKQIS